ncbi:hypothetical protein UFOVP1516_48 [uncultured Caudovirales phage]|uniref:Uncharacterized protein n=1 Tax=uncultured Caudovirales phage TaxID=2100421 RepID=A0A6J5PJE6_9CAUD|nr:hypothetical protein UFOVP887_87 [uncultured Caudovirales phage]CAB5226877.1 hypothetical protein UFOVP1516_48 [uncultured Caudovirales phage]
MNKELEAMIEICEFLQDKMTEAQAFRLLDRARSNLGQDELSELEFHALGSKLYPMLREMQAEKGWW